MKKYAMKKEGNLEFAKEHFLIGTLKNQHKHVNLSFMGDVKLAPLQTNLKLRRFVRKLVQNHKGLSM